jgi:hypothetical protein
VEAKLLKRTIRIEGIGKRMKYNEKKILSDVEKYIKSTYSSHYVRGNDIQVNDLIMAIGHGEGSYVSNAIEYLARYGKKEGRNPKDLYKAIHNIILLINMNHESVSKQILLEFEGDR